MRTSPQKKSDELTRAILDELTHFTPLAWALRSLETSDLEEIRHFIKQLLQKALGEK